MRVAINLVKNGEFETTKVQPRTWSPLRDVESWYSTEGKVDIIIGLVSAPLRFIDKLTEQIGDDLGRQHRRPFDWLEASVQADSRDFADRDMKVGSVFVAQQLEKFIEFGHGFTDIARVFPSAGRRSPWL